jgi:hypothetical protein
VKVKKEISAEQRAVESKKRAARRNTAKAAGDKSEGRRHKGKEAEVLQFA